MTRTTKPKWQYSHCSFLNAFYLSGLPCPPSGDLPNPGIEHRSPTLQADSLPSEPPGKPKNTGVSSLSLLQGIFLTQESNWGLLHCRHILYQLSSQGITPNYRVWNTLLEGKSPWCLGSAHSKLPYRPGEACTPWWAASPRWAEEAWLG